MHRFNLLDGPAAPDLSIKPFFALRRARVGDPFQLVARWLLGNQSALPRETDTFEVRIKLKIKGWFLKPDGTFDQTGADAFIPVRPKNFFMLDPTRAELVVDPRGATPMAWQIAQAPTKAVDCGLSIQATMPPGEPFGVCHLLREVQPSRVELKSLRLIQPHLAGALAELKPKASRFSLFSSFAEPERPLARHLARLVVRGGIRPMHLPRVAVRHYQELASFTQARKSGLTAEKPPARNMFLSAAPNFHPWEFAAVATRVFANKTLMDLLEETVTPANSVREQLRLRALHGGALINYWTASEDGAANEGQRGQQASAADVLGLGLTIGSFSEAVVQSWEDDTLILTVKQQSAHGLQEIGFTDEVPDDTEHLLAAELDQTFTDGEFPFDFPAEVIAKTLQRNSSIAPPAPLKAAVNYDLMQSNPGANEEKEKEVINKTGATFAYRTGDGRMEIVITPPLFTALEGKTVYGYNVYGMWETAQTQAYFQDPAKVPSPEERGRYLITRRYSYERDLKDAFPDFNQAVHPGLKLALEWPPQEAVLERAEKYTDEHEAENKDPLPNVANSSGGVLLTEWNFDLRTGMRLHDKSARPFPDWDPKALVHTEWKPTENRDGSIAAAPQRYRFWVASVDSFEQESVLVPVRTDDADAGDSAASYYFKPVQRTPLLPPVAQAEDGASGRRLTYTANRLTVLWDTPPLNSTASRKEDEKIADKADLVCYVAVLRRLLRSKVDEQVSFGFSAAAFAQGMPNPRWEAALTAIKEEDQTWEPFVHPTAVAAPGGAGDEWSFSKVLAHPDTGYEYMALISAEVKPDRRAFWAPSAIVDQANSNSGRRVQVTETPEGGEPTLVIMRISERPTESEVVTTKGLPVPNVEEPRGVQMILPTGQTLPPFWPAAPVLPPPSVDRDLVLLKLLNLRFTEDPSTLPPWRDTGVPLTSGQAAMIETAFARTFPQGGTPQPDENLRDARWLLAAEFNNPAADGVDFYRQHATVGFRGLQQLNWRYTPSVVDLLKNDEAETVRFKIYHVRVPTAPDRALRYASFVIDANFVAGSKYRSAAATPVEIEVLTMNRQPAFARIQDAAGNVVTAVVGTAVRDAVTKILELEFEDASGALPHGAVKLHLYVAQPILDIPVTSWARETQYHTYVPVGGGVDEDYCWWIAPVSAQEVEVGPHPGRRPHVVRRFPRSIQPETPQFLQVTPPFDDATHLLNPQVAGDRKWLPTEISSPAAGIAKPRLVISWGALVEPGIKITIEREERKVTASENQFRSLVEPTAWKSIKSIEEAPKDKPMESAWLRAITGNWLLGRQVEIDADDAPLDPTTNFVPPQQDLPPDGIRALPAISPAGVVNRPAFVDYFLHANDTVHATDGSWEYRYRLRAFIDLGAQVPDLKWRYLLSHPTLWTAWALPATLPISLRARQPDTVEHLTTLPAPEVLFRFEVPQGTQAAGLQYRVVIRRQLGFSLGVVPNSAPAPKMLLVGQPLHLPTPNGEPAVIADRQLDRDEPDLPLDLHYEISVTEFTIADGRERLIRHQTSTFTGSDPGAVTVPSPQSPQTEVRLTRVVLIDV
jgi:hypothetical protein